MSSTWVGLAVSPIVVFMVIVMECSRLHCAQVVQRRLVAQARESGQTQGIASRPTAKKSPVPLAVRCALEDERVASCSALEHRGIAHPGSPAWAGPGE